MTTVEELQAVNVLDYANPTPVTRVCKIPKGNGCQILHEFWLWWFNNKNYNVCNVFFSGWQYCLDWSFDYK